LAKDFLNAENVIGENSYFQGSLKLKGNLRVDGKFEGDELKVNSLVIGPSGKVKTNIDAHNATIEGILIGTIKSKVRTILLPTAKILGDIYTPELIIQNGVVFEGKCKITHEDNTSAQTLIEDLYTKNDKPNAFQTPQPSNKRKF